MADFRGTSGSDTYTGTNDAELIYGYPEAGTPPSKVIASGLYRPLFATAPEGDTGRLFVVSQGGAIKIHNLNNPEAPTQTFLDISSRVNNNTEAGLLGFTFHPDFATNGKCYVNYTTPDNDQGTGRKQAIVEYTFDPNDLSQAPTEKTIMLIDYPQEHTHHRAGWLDFGPDGMLYIATGEDTVAANAQTVVNQDGSINHLGKMLRIDIRGDDFPTDANRNYRIPTDNPRAFDNITGELAQPSEIWAVGLRNPWRASFGPDGKLYVADVGQNTYEEINIVEAGKNYGWRVAPVADGPQNIPGYTDPYHYYGRDVGGSVTGGYFYEGPGPLNGKYIFGDFNNGHIFAMNVGGTPPVVEDITTFFRDANGNPMQFGHLSSFGLDGQGNLYAISYADDEWSADSGRVFRLSDNTPVQDAGDSLDGAGGNDTIYGGGGDDTLNGGADGDSLYGEADNDDLSGVAGNDTIYGGTGNDTIDGGINNDHLYGDADDDRLNGSLGFDTLDGGEGSDILDGSDGNDTIYCGAGNDTLYGNTNDDHLFGNAGDDLLSDTIGENILTGGTGNDVYIVSSGTEIVEAVGGGKDEVRTLTSFALQDGQEVEAMRADDMSSKAELNLTGNEFAQELIGNAGSNFLNGRGGADTMEGLDGNDGYAVDNVGDIIKEKASEGIDGITSMIDYTLGDNLENLVLQGTAVKGTGNALDNDITGNDADNILDGGAGQDSLRGGGGNDTYEVDSAGDEIYEDDGKGTDTITTSVSYDLNDAARVEIIEAADGDEAINLTGNTHDNILRGNSGANRLDGDGGNDTVVFTGKLSDYTIERGTGDEIIMTDKNSPGDKDTISNMEFFQFSDRTVSLDGLLNTPPSGLKLEGDAVYENSEKGQFIGDFSVTDNSGDRHTFALTNNADGRFSIDPDGTLRVADGVRLDYEQATQHAIEVKATDRFGESITETFVIRIQDSLDERATGSAGADVMKGGNGSDSFNGLAGNDRIESGLGSDTLMGGSENDTLDASDGNDRLSGETGNDSLIGGLGNDTGEGGADNDLLNGGLGNDRLLGGLGKDTLTGGTGRDVFVFDDRETGSSKTKADYITDFSGRGGDRIDLKLVDADTKKRGDQKFSFIGEKAFTKAGQVRYEKTKKETYVYLNTDSDKAAEAVIKLKGAIDLQKGWFVL